MLDPAAPAGAGGDRDQSGLLERSASARRRVRRMAYGALYGRCGCASVEWMVMLRHLAQTVGGATAMAGKVAMSRRPDDDEAEAFLGPRRSCVFGWGCCSAPSAAVNRVCSSGLLQPPPCEAMASMPGRPQTTAGPAWPEWGVENSIDGQLHRGVDHFLGWCNLGEGHLGQVQRYRA